MSAADAADPVNIKPEQDPCATGFVATSLDIFLMAAATQAVDSPLLDCLVDRDFRMRDQFPPRVIAEDEVRPDGFLAKFVDALDREVNAAFNRVDCFPTIRDLQRAPTEFLDLLLHDLGNPFALEEGSTDQEKRKLIAVLGTLYALAGTCFGIIGAVSILFGIRVTECIQANVDCWDLDTDQLDLTTILCPSTAFDRRSFSIMVDTNLTDRQRQQVTNIVDWIKPANTHFLGIIEPGSDAHVSHWILELSSFNVNTDLH